MSERKYIRGTLIMVAILSKACVLDRHGNVIAAVDTEATDFIYIGYDWCIADYFWNVTKFNLRKYKLSRADVSFGKLNKNCRELVYYNIFDGVPVFAWEDDDYYIKLLLIGEHNSSRQANNFIQ